MASKYEATFEVIDNLPSICVSSERLQDVILISAMTVFGLVFPLVRYCRVFFYQLINDCDHCLLAMNFSINPQQQKEKKSSFILDRTRTVDSVS